MRLGSVLQSIARLFAPEHRGVKSFEQEIEPRVAGRVDAGMKTVPAERIVGSVGRSHNLRSDFFYRTGRAMTARFVSIGKAMEAGKVLPPIEVYKAKVRRQPGPLGPARDAVTEYYVVDGHHRVAMAKKLGQDYLDAHVVEYKVQDAPAPAESATPAAPAEPPPESVAPAGDPPAAGSAMSTQSGIAAKTA